MSSSINRVLILNFASKKFEVISNVPDDIIQEQEKVEDMLENYYNYDLRKISWTSDSDINPEKPFLDTYNYKNLD